MEPFQHQRLALEVSRRGAMELAGGNKTKTKNERLPRSSGERLPRWRRSTRVRGRSGSRARRRSHECAGELGAEQQWRAQEREAEEEEGVCEKEEPEALPYGLYGRRGRGVGSSCGRVARCVLAHRKSNRQTDADPSVGSEACDVGAKACGYVKSCVGRGPQSIDCSPEESEVTCDVGWLKRRSR